MDKQYILKIAKKGLDFENTTDEFIEVVFEIDGKELRSGNKVIKKTKGFCYPPKYHKIIIADIKKGSIIKAYIYQGDGQENVDLDKPAYLRKKEGRKATFHRTSHEPVNILELIV
jgi:hypothetical protein